MFTLDNKILIIDDEKEICELIRDYLKREGFDVYIALDGEEGLEVYKKISPSLVVLDIMMPKLDGMEICKIIRNESNIPIIMLSARKEEVDKILGLGFGADDYITKPFSPRELVARIKAQIRRFTKLSTSYIDENKINKSILKFGNLEIDSKGYNVYKNMKKIELATKEFEILNYLAQNPNIVFSREKIFNKIWGYNDFGDINTVTVHVRKIREKIEENPSNPRFIKTVWGVGYKFEGGQK